MVLVLGIGASLGVTSLANGHVVTHDAATRPLIFATNGDGRSGTLELAVIRPDGTGFRKLTRRGGGPTSSPTWTTDGERITFHAYDEFSDVDTTWRIRADGTRRERLPGGEWDPPSPSGDSVHIWDRIVDIKGRTLRTLRLGRIGRHDVYAGPPVWSPDGRYLALNMYTETQRELYTWILVVPTDGRGVARAVTPRGDGHHADAASWSPDSRRLLVGGEDARGRDVWYTIARDGSDRRPLRARLNGWHSWSPDSTTIAYVQSGAIMGVRVEGGRSRRLISIRSRGRQARYVMLDWSARGELAFTDLGGLYVARPGGGGLHRVTARVGAPDWSPDGQRVVFSNHGEIFVVDRRGRGLRRLTRWSWDDAPTWSPDGRRIAFVRGSRVYATSGAASRLADVYVMASDGKGQRRIGQGYEPHWAPGGGRIAFVRSLAPARGPPRHRIVMSNVDGSGRVEMEGLDPAWSPDGEQLALVRHMYDEARENDWVAYASTLLIARRDGSDLRSLEDDSWLLFDPQWSPDGSTIAVSAWNENLQTERLQLVEIATGSVRTLRRKRPDSFAWSPDGRSIAFADCRGRRAVLAVLGVETGSTRIIAEATGEDNCPAYESFAWSPDGERIGYVRCTPFDVEPKACDVHVTNADGSRPRRLTSTFGIERSLDW